MLYTIRTFPLEYRIEEAESCLVGIPWDSTETGRPVRYGPLFIRQALRETPGFDPETGKTVFEGKFCDLGDIEVVPGNWTLTRERILDTLDFLFKANPRAFPLALGGDHLITLAILEGLKKQHTAFSVIHFDAHADLSPDWMGEPFSHITWAFHARALGLDLAQVGVRSWTREEHEFLQQSKGAVKSLDQVRGPAYLTIDLDVLDPAFAPEVGTPEPLGMNPKEFFDSLKKACALPLLGLDIVECASDRVGTPTAALAATIIKKVEAWRKR